MAVTNHQRVELKRAVDSWVGHHVRDLLPQLPTSARWDEHAIKVLLRAAYYFGVGQPTIRNWAAHGLTEQDITNLTDWFVHPHIFYDTHKGARAISKVRIATERAKRVTRPSHVSNDGTAFIASFEGFEPYWRDDGFGNPTVGFGHTRPDGPVATPINRTQGLALLKRDLVPYENAVKSHITRRLKQSQFDALVSFVYNVGPGALNDGIAAKINAGDFHRAANIILQYDHANGQQVWGLTLRRRAEVAKLLS